MLWNAVELDQLVFPASRRGLQNTYVAYRSSGSSAGANNKDQLPAPRTANGTQLRALAGASAGTPVDVQPTNGDVGRKVAAAANGAARQRIAQARARCTARCILVSRDVDHTNIEMA